MDLEIIPKQDAAALEFDSTEIKITHIEYLGESPSKKVFEFESDEITEKVISELLGQIMSGTCVYLSLHRIARTTGWKL